MSPAIFQDLIVQTVALRSAQTPAEAAADKARFHRAGRAFLQRLADDIGLPHGTYEIRSNKAGPAVSGEVTLHGQTFYAWLRESCVSKPGVSLIYRTCKGPKDYCGGTNHSLHLSTLTQATYAALVARCRALAATVEAQP